MGMDLTKWNAVSNLADTSHLKLFITCISILQIKYYFLNKFVFSVIKNHLIFILYQNLYENNRL